MKHAFMMEILQAFLARLVHKVAQKSLTSKDRLLEAITGISQRKCFRCLPRQVARNQYMHAYVPVFKSSLAHAGFDPLQSYAERSARNLRMVVCATRFLLAIMAAATQINQIICLKNTSQINK